MENKVLTKKEQQHLEELITSYYANKKSLDDFKKTCDTENKEIKSIMGVDKHVFGDYKASVTESHKYKFDEAKMLSILKANGFTQAIKTREYVDMDELESLMYHGEIPADVTKLLGDCKHEEVIQTLRVTKR